MAGVGHCSYGGFLKWWVSPNNHGVFLPKNDHDLGCEMGGTTNFRKHPYGVTAMLGLGGMKVFGNCLRSPPWVANYADRQVLTRIFVT